MISIILPIYNEESSINRLLNSIVEQTYKNFEVIIVNDGSTDKSENLCLNFINGDNRFKYFYQENRGVAEARNFALKQCKGEYISFIDGDDYIESNYLEKLVDPFLNNSKIDMVVCSYTQNGELRKFENEILNQEMVINELTNIKGSKGYLWNKLFKQSIIEKLGLNFDKKILVASDLPFCVEYILSGSIFKYISDVLIHYSINSDSISSNISNTKILTQFSAIKRCIELLKNNKYNKNLVDKYIALHIRTVSGVILRHSFILNNELYDFLYKQLNMYSLNLTMGILIYVKYILANAYLFFIGLKMKFSGRIS